MSALISWDCIAEFGHQGLFDKSGIKRRACPRADKLLFVIRFVLSKDVELHGAAAVADTRGIKAISS